LLSCLWHIQGCLSIPSAFENFSILSMTNIWFFLMLTFFDYHVQTSGHETKKHLTSILCLHFVNKLVIIICSMIWQYMYSYYRHDGKIYVFITSVNIIIGYIHRHKWHLHGVFWMEMLD
jgi:putative effector of murein hydrolase